MNALFQRHISHTLIFFFRIWVQQERMGMFYASVGNHLHRNFMCELLHIYGWRQVVLFIASCPNIRVRWCPVSTIMIIIITIRMRCIERA